MDVKINNCSNSIFWISNQFNQYSMLKPRQQMELNQEYAILIPQQSKHNIIPLAVKYNFNGEDAPLLLNLFEDSFIMGDSVRYEYCLVQAQLKQSYLAEYYIANRKQAEEIIDQHLKKKKKTEKIWLFLHPFIDILFEGPLLLLFFVLWPEIILYFFLFFFIINFIVTIIINFGSNYRNNKRREKGLSHKPSREEMLSDRYINAYINSR